MSDDIEGIVRTVSGFSKKKDKFGHYRREVRYNLKPLKLSFLQELFNVNPDATEDEERFMLLCYNIFPKQAAKLQPYVIEGIIDLQKYFFQLTCHRDDS